MVSTIEQVRLKIRELNLTVGMAAKDIGVTSGSLEKHLSGEYARSDSLAKYRTWLSNGSDQCSVKAQNVHQSEDPTEEPIEAYSPLSDLVVFEGQRPGNRIFNVVDLFSGCGGMSLGFDLLEAGTVYQTVLAMDIEEPMVACYNENHNILRGEATNICRRINLAEFDNESEILAFYLDHYARIAKDHELAKELNQLPMGGLDTFKSLIGQVDSLFLARLDNIRNSAPFKAEYTKGVMASLGQTAVTGFQNALCLPLLSSRAPSLGPILWADLPGIESKEPDNAISGELKKLRDRATKEVKAKWEQELANLIAKTSGRGRGQLASSAGKIGDFVAFLESPPMKSVRSAWIEWLASRTALRRLYFNAPEMLVLLKAAYRDARKADVVIGGPPCQGFSRIGRGKIRSLQASGVHVQEHAEAGDQRNLLLYKYVMFVGALAPKVFLFENVSQFQSEVKTSEGTFLASEILAEAIRDISNEHVEYSVDSRIISCSAHLIPQARQRFFMSGIRDDILEAGESDTIPNWIISLPQRPAVPLLSALEGLPEPFYAGRDEALPVDLAREVACLPNGRDQSGHSEAVYRDWICQTPPPAKRKANSAGTVDSHYARRPRRDDEEFFSLVGPGKRWMDYRCDCSPTLNDISELVKTIKSLVELAEQAGSGAVSEIIKIIDKDMLERVERSVDGSLSLRLLLETIKPRQGEIHHHLATPTYLEKKNGNHGDWLSRLDASKPSKTIVSHMAKDTYAYIHPFVPRTLSVREAARIQSFPDWFSFSCLGLVDAYRVVGNAVPPLLSFQLAERVAQVLWKDEVRTAVSVK